MSRCTKCCLLLFCNKWLFCEPSAYENLSNQNKVLYFKRHFGGYFPWSGYLLGVLSTGCRPITFLPPRGTTASTEGGGRPRAILSIQLVPTGNQVLTSVSSQVRDRDAGLPAPWAFWRATVKSLVWMTWWSAKGFQIHDHVFPSFTHLASTHHLSRKPVISI